MNMVFDHKEKLLCLAHRHSKDLPNERTFTIERENEIMPSKYFVSTSQQKEIFRLEKKCNKREEKK